MLQLANVTFDAADPPKLAAFWAAATGRRIERSEPYFAVLTSDADPIRMLFLKVPEGKTVKNRMHVDFTAADREAEVARLVGLGATRGPSHDEYGVNWTVLQDPEGNEFCVAQA
ncbi:MAG TPA: VOC family protein [Chloroflexota bacterium]|nr:VOC family protein [Chloroflexota bacterium]